MEAKEDFRLRNEVEDFAKKVQREHFSKTEEGEKKRRKGLIILSFEEGKDMNGHVEVVLGNREALVYSLVKSLSNVESHFSELLNDAVEYLQDALLKEIKDIAKDESE